MITRARVAFVAFAVLGLTGACSQAPIDVATIAPSNQIGRAHV